MLSFFSLNCAPLLIQLDLQNKLKPTDRNFKQNMFKKLNNTEFDDSEFVSNGVAKIYIGIE